MPGLAHLYIGQEAVAVGVCEALRRDDFITSTHRGHGHCLAKGASVDRMFAELLGKAPGYCRGKGARCTSRTRRRATWVLDPGRATHGPGLLDART
jgi:TPP-dependent pyruvate/acetoin dehydrogenase alpha subunit